ncbi:MAG: chemotaxis protein CheA [Oscillospiraceae bacterium]|nr:chemotaxis protein CheA [Oscillospiraceae bacterium]
MMRELDPMLDVFIFETQQLLESLEEVLLQSEKDKNLTDEHIDEIFRIMHTIKGSSAMMSFDNLAKLAHALEDMFDNIRAGKTRKSPDVVENVTDLVLDSGDIFKNEIGKLSSGAEADGDFTELSDKIHTYTQEILADAAASTAASSGSAPAAAAAAPDSFAASSAGGNPNIPVYKIKVTFEAGCQMENLRAFTVVNALIDHCQNILHVPEDIDDKDSSDIIINNGFVMYVQSTENPDTLQKIVDSTMYVSSVSLIDMAPDSEELPASMRVKPASSEAGAGGAADSIKAVAATTEIKQNFISVNVNKLDKLMNLMGEIVTTESMVTKNPEVANLHIDSFERSSQELRKLINELQDIVTSMRMLPVSNSFHKMLRIARDVSKAVGKEVELTLIGEETEVDKNIIDTLSDPLMHLIRNAVDHGIETPDVRLKAGKPAVGKLVLEARSAGGDVVILITDDGQGLDRNTILRKANERGLTTKPDSEYTDKEVYHMIFLPGFSTNEEVTEFSGRGVGMDVVRRNIDKVGGVISLESTPGEGMTVQIRCRNHTRPCRIWHGRAQ